MCLCSFMVSTRSHLRLSGSKTCFNCSIKNDHVLSVWLMLTKLISGWYNERIFPVWGTGTVALFSVLKYFTDRTIIRNNVSTLWNQGRDGGWHRGISHLHSALSNVNKCLLKLKLLYFIQSIVYPRTICWPGQEFVSHARSFASFRAVFGYRLVSWFDYVPYLQTICQWNSSLLMPDTSMCYIY